MIPRQSAATLKRLARGFPVVAVTGPRQSGKTTLVRMVFPRKRYITMEDPDQAAFAAGDPRGFLDRLPDGAILDEAQRAPQLFSYLQGRVDEERRMGLFVLTGSQQFGLLSRITQSLAGRVGLLQLLPFSLAELTEAKKIPRSLDVVLFRGLYPALYDRRLAPPDWHANYLMTYVERDLRQVTEVRDLALFQRFLRLCAARSGQLLNQAGLADEVGVSNVTIRRWLTVLEASYLIFLLRPHHASLGKRLVKMPKLYFFDPGLAAWLLEIQDPGHLSIHPSRGALFETLVASELIKARFNRGEPANLFFWRDNTGNEVDFLLERGDRLLPIEVKGSKTPSATLTRGLDRWANRAGKKTGGRPLLVYGGEESFTREGVGYRGWNDLPDPDDPALWGK
jgi:predicted AAA+ superfamily ATPase